MQHIIDIYFVYLIIINIKPKDIMIALKYLRSHFHFKSDKMEADIIERSVFISGL